MKIPARILFTFAFALLARTPLPAADTIEIQQHWMAGKKYFQTIETEQHSTVDFGARKMEQSMNMTMELTITVSPHQDGQPKRMAIRYERVAMDMTMNGQKMGYDSAKPDAGGDPLGFGKSMGATVGQELKVVLNDKDGIESIENYDDFIKHFPASTTPGFDPAKMFSRESLTQMMKQGSLQAMPGKPVEVGATWPFNNQIALAQLGKITVSGNYTLKSVGEHNGVKCAEIITDGTLAMDLGDATAGNSPLNALGMKITAGTMKGPVWFDLALGIARETHLVQEMTMSMKNPSDPTATIDMPMKQNVTVTLTKVEDVK